MPRVAATTLILDIDPTLPLLANPEDPTCPLRPDSLKVGQRVLHRSFGPGVVTSIAPSQRDTKIGVQFDDEGPKMLMLPSDGSPLPRKP